MTRPIVPAGTRAGVDEQSSIDLQRSMAAFEELVLAFGETRDHTHVLGADDIPATVYQTLANGYTQLKERVRSAFPTIPTPMGDISPADILPDLNADRFRGFVSTLSPEVLATYRVTKGSCAELDRVEILKVRDRLTSLKKAGLSVWDIEVSVTPDYSFVEMPPGLRDCNPMMQRLTDYLQAMQEWRESGSEEEARPQPATFGLKGDLEQLNEDVKDGMKARTFQLDWFLSVTVARFEYEIRAATEYLVVETRCCTDE